MGWVVNAKLRPLYPQERDPVHIAQAAGWENLVLTGIRPPHGPARSESLYRLLNFAYKTARSEHVCGLHPD